ncbi:MULTISPECIES: IMPACT family protein [Pseudomonas]|uniref:YigZ family protein n=1 Tax=Pseudomonas quercus TaxID=2722792 RepID=A0ABX0YC14_9PSED|nr:MULTISPECIES: YigZ family protein [Pseudomonas]MBF7141952.1 YigZ family protein [Pseudomonas sp. LY10J]NJP00490.1 YigZ family protein [Pseudomonas quercus]
MKFVLPTVAQYREEIRKSRFLAIAGPIGSPDEAQAFLHSQGDAQATHNCWAWKIGGQYRSSDDGEPGGTAGRPILAAIEAQGVDQVMVVVTRWYGGIQLGTGGLARAYGGCANKCLQLADKHPLVERSMFACRCFFNELALVRLRVSEASGEVLSEAFEADGVNLTLALPAHAAPSLAEQLAQLSRGRMQLVACG